MFQSSPGPKTGCNNSFGRSVCPCDHPCFNPHPARRPGATRFAGGGIVVEQPVSILTRPEDRVQHVVRRTGRVRAGRCFNPHPARRPGATRQSRGARPALPRFNPHPARRPGATCFGGLLGVVADVVSILTRPEDRVQRTRRGRSRRSPTTFQSSPGPKTGCN